MSSRRIESTLLPHLDSAYNLARWLTGDEHDAGDVTQEAFARAVKFFPGLHGDARPWLLRIVRNTFYSWRERNGRRAIEPFIDELHAIERDGNGAGSLLVRGVDIGQLRAAVESLVIEYREAVVLRELERLSYAEISRVVGVPIGTVMSRIARGRARARAFLLRSCA